jgi:hypothetical protein
MAFVVKKSLKSGLDQLTDLIPEKEKSRGSCYNNNVDACQVVWSLFPANLEQTEVKVRHAGGKKPLSAVIVRIR